MNENNIPFKIRSFSQKVKSASDDKTFSSYEYSKHAEQTICSTEATHISDSRV